MNNKKISKLMLFIGILFISLVVHITAIDLFKHDEYASKSYASRKDYVRRGNIYDRNGVLLAHSTGDIKEQVREYPFNEKYVHIIGYVTKENNTNEIERLYNSQLMGESEAPLLGGIMTFLSDTKFAMTGKTEKSGSNLTLTIDNELQHAAHAALGSYKGAIVAMNCDSGEILAMVSKPDFNPNPDVYSSEYERIQELGDGFNGKGIKELYPPASTFKIIVASALIDNYKEDYVIDGNTQLRTEVKEYGQTVQKVSSTLDLATAFKKSSNIYFAESGIELGKEKILEAARNFMFEEKINLEDFYVANNTLPADNILTNNRAISNLAIGQGEVKTTPLHLAMIASAIGNEGVMMQPYIVSEISSPSYYKAKPKILKRSVSMDTAQKIKDLMRACVESGTGIGANIPNRGICGKTGTAELDRENGTSHAHFVGFAPYDDPKIAISVVIEDVAEGQSGGGIAAPVAEKVFRRYFELYG